MISDKQLPANQAIQNLPKVLRATPGTETDYQPLILSILGQLTESESDRELCIRALSPLYAYFGADFTEKVYTPFFAGFIDAELQRPEPEDSESYLKELFTETLVELVFETQDTHMQTSIVALVKQGHLGRFYELLPDKIADFKGEWVQMQPLMKFLCAVDKQFTQFTSKSWRTQIHFIQMATTVVKYCSPHASDALRILI